MLAKLPNEKDNHKIYNLPNSDNHQDTNRFPRQSSRLLSYSNFSRELMIPNFLNNKNKRKYHEFGHLLKNLPQCLKKQLQNIKGLLVGNEKGPKSTTSLKNDKTPNN